MRSFFIPMIRASVLLCFLCGGVSDAAEKPNFVITIADDHGVYHSSVYGSSEFQTPNLQQMAEEGIRFDNAYVASPACAPSRAALFTGRMPYSNGIVGNHEFDLKPGVKSLLPTLLQQGYEVVFHGKIGHSGPKHFGQYVPDGVKILGGGGLQQTMTLDQVESFLKARPENAPPLALFLGWTDTHTAWPPKEEARIAPHEVVIPAKIFDTPEARVEMTRYVEGAEAIDRRVGKTRDLIAEHLDLSNTMVVYTSDHGMPWPFAKWSLYETGIRTPLIAVWPGKIKPSSSTDAMVSWIDLIPTLIDLAGGTVPSGIEGRSFAKVLFGETDQHRDVIFATHKGDNEKNVYPIRSVRVGKWKYIRNLHPEFAYTTHTDVWATETPRIEGHWAHAGHHWQSYIDAAQTDPEAAAFLHDYHSSPAEELYDVVADPFEQNNLAESTQHADKLAELRAMVTLRMTQVGDDQSLSGPPKMLEEFSLPTLKANNHAIADPPDLDRCRISTVAENGMPKDIVKKGAQWNFGPGSLWTHRGWQYAAYWDDARQVSIARRELPSGAWSVVSLPGYQRTENVNRGKVGPIARGFGDGHEKVAMGISSDGVIHLAFDHHGSTLHYRATKTGVANAPASHDWIADLFGPVQDNLGAGVIDFVTYPSFTVDGEHLSLYLRLSGGSGSADSHFMQYTNGRWTTADPAAGKLIDKNWSGGNGTVNAYPHRLVVCNGRRHLTWCWRDTPGASTCHDLCYAYSDDQGKTWLNNEGRMIGRTGSQFITADSPGVEAWKIPAGTSYINGGSMTVDKAGRVHVVMRGETGKPVYFRRDPKSKQWTRSGLERLGALAVGPDDRLHVISAEGVWRMSLKDPPTLEPLSKGHEQHFLDCKMGIDQSRIDHDGWVSVIGQTGKRVTVIDYRLGAIPGKEAKLESNQAPAQTGSWGDQGDGTYKNPILNADYANADVVQLGDTYYMITTKKQMAPGMVILESKDMVNWTIISHVWDRLSWAPEYNWDQMNGYAFGVWAGDLAYHDGKWYCYMIDYNHGLLVSTATDIRGTWTDPHQMLPSQKVLDDPAVYWDDEAHEAFLICNTVGKQKKPGSKASGNENRLYRMSWDGLEIIDDGKVIYTGPGAEAAKIHRIEGVWYLFLAEWFPGKKNSKNPADARDRKQIVLRSTTDSIYGPYEKKIVMERGNGVLRSCSQGALMQAPDESWWYTHQLIQNIDSPFQGRPQMLEPVSWVNGWPIIGVDIDNDGIGEPVLQHRKPIQGFPITAPQTDDDFTSDSLGMQWEWNHNPKNQNWSLSERPGWLRLTAGIPVSEAISKGPKNTRWSKSSKSSFAFWRAANTLSQRIMGTTTGTATARFDISAMVPGQVAGFVRFSAGYHILGIKVDADGTRHLFYTNADGEEVDGPKIEVNEIVIQTTNHADQAFYEYSLGGDRFIRFGPTFTIKYGTWMGNRLGLFCWNENEEKGHVDIDWFTYEYDGPKGSMAEMNDCDDTARMQHDPDSVNEP